MKDGPTRRTDAVHEQIVEQAFLQNCSARASHHTKPTPKSRADHDSAGNHAEAIAPATRAPDPDGEPDDEEQQQIRILLKIGEKPSMVGSPLRFVAAAFGFVAPEAFRPPQSLPALRR